MIKINDMLNIENPICHPMSRGLDIIKYIFLKTEELKT